MDKKNKEQSMIDGAQAQPDVQKSMEDVLSSANSNDEQGVEHAEVVEQTEQAAEKQPAKDNADNTDELAACKKKLQETEERLLRVQAEADNVARRSLQEINKALRFGNEDLIKELLPVIDSLEKAIKSCQENAALSGVLEGIELTHKLLLTVLEKKSVKVINPQGENFDPNLHEAISSQKSAGVEANKVLQVIQKGYVLHDRVLRAAMVIVSQ